MDDIVHVAVAVLVNDADEICISLRHQDAHQGGLWEFPGGKIEQGESVDIALAREIKEELNLVINQSRPLIKITHCYPGIKVCLHVHKILSFDGEAVGSEGQQIKWVAIDQLAEYDFPEANFSIVKALQLPDKYLITGEFNDADDLLEKLVSALRNNIKLVQLRLKSEDIKDLENVPALLHKIMQLCKQAEAKLMLNIPNDLLSSIDLSATGIDGVHADSRTLMSLSSRPKSNLFSASCHSVEQLLKAEQLKADFVVLSPVQKTASHPDVQPIGWQKFAEMTEELSIPVYALGGVSADDVDKAWLHGGQGIAAISAFWGKT